MNLYVTATDKVRSSDFDAAVDDFIEVIRRERRYDDDGSRKACVAIFTLLGEEHEVTRKYRSALSAALF